MPSTHKQNASLRIATTKSEVIAALPKACSDERAAVEFFEAQRWPNGAGCPKCGDVDVYQMRDKETGERQANFRWRCRGCKAQFTVRVGTIFEDSPVPLHKWAHAIWLAASCKKGVAALELCRVIQVSYKTALFMMHRIRFGMAEPEGEPLTGVVEVDEKYVGGSPRKLSKAAKEKLIAEGKEVPQNKRGRGTKKIPVVSAVQRGGKVRSRVVANVTGANLREFLTANVAPTATVCTDEAREYPYATRGHVAHHTTNHSQNEYARTDKASGLRVHSNTAESNFALLERAMIGTWHRVSAQHLHRYVANMDFLWNTRKESDGDRVSTLIRACEGKRLMYRDSPVRMAV